MKQTIVYTISYFSLIILIIVGILFLLNIFELIDLSDSESMFLLYFIALPCGYFYHKYKPMEMREVLDKIKEKFH